MNALTVVKKMKKMGGRSYGAKRFVIFLINRRLARNRGAAALGSITDLRVDRTDRSLLVQSTRDGAVTTLNISGYRFFTERQRSYLGWSALEIDGPMRHHYWQALLGVHRIEVPKSSVKFLEALL
ncbi:hypothetical protein [Desulfofustis glycolicus]|uniref:Uncharacterized protein n=1 Tax=Desulfofustis glycolicus DSM 9705 TaxID=1121409 RepID=A0A1M5YMV7_9BACT|nr:hypothetical protein [Desulfofustis glycolicus]MCB2218397.1 hypothetical protein [Desulfobulbaceae bacterium]SHI13239.1 hypothetical protein SAMN02745124_04223 [Desulfofustis glycolicus DSM 9705]